MNDQIAVVCARFFSETDVLTRDYIEDQRLELVESPCLIQVLNKCALGST
jgi:hypothetical protein